MKFTAPTVTTLNAIKILVDAGYKDTLDPIEFGVTIPVDSKIASAILTSIDESIAKNDATFTFKTEEESETFLELLEYGIDIHDGNNLLHMFIEEIFGMVDEDYDADSAIQEILEEIQEMIEEQNSFF